MKHKVLLIIAGLLAAFSCAAATGEAIRTDNMTLLRVGSNLHVSADIVLDGFQLKGNEQVFMTPVITGEDGKRVELPTVLVTGRNMHYAYERGTMRGLKDFRQRYNISKEVRRDNGKPQTVKYLGSTPMQGWMKCEKLHLQFVFDNCGCGVPNGSSLSEGIDTLLNPSAGMYLAYLTPQVTELPVAIHEGKARVQFEVNKTELHDSIYRCGNGQRIDNRSQLKVIYDSIEYALLDPNVELARIEIIGYASPESPYLHNKELATGRSRALADYIGKYVGKKYQLSQELTAFDAVPENWVEFREQVVASNEITEKQREDLLELIDKPAFSPADYDAKEKELKTNPKFKDLYRTKILPEWFPHLRATKFRISTRLKPLDDEKLADVLKSTPEKLSLNQMMRVARLYPEGSEEFNKVIQTALKYYPDSEVANLNAAVAALGKGEYERAEALLEKAEDSPEKVNAEAVILVHKGEIDEARRLLKSVEILPEARKNLQLLSDD